MDGIVNFSDFAVFAEAWRQTNPPDISLDNDNDVDINDLKIFAEGWLWTSPSFNISLMNQSEETISISDENDSNTPTEGTLGTYNSEAYGNGANGYGTNNY